MELVQLAGDGNLVRPELVEPLQAVGDGLVGKKRVDVGYSAQQLQVFLEPGFSGGFFDLFKKGRRSG